MPTKTIRFVTDPYAGWPSNQYYYARDLKPSYPKISLCVGGVKEWFNLPLGTREFWLNIHTTKPRGQHHKVKWDNTDCCYGFVDVTETGCFGQAISPWPSYLDDVARDFSKNKTLYVSVEVLDK